MVSTVIKDIRAVKEGCEDKFNAIEISYEDTTRSINGNTRCYFRSVVIPPEQFVNLEKAINVVRRAALAPKIGDLVENGKARVISKVGDMMMLESTEEAGA